MQESSMAGLLNYYNTKNLISFYVGCVMVRES